MPFSEIQHQHPRRDLHGGVQGREQQHTCREHVKQIHSAHLRHIPADQTRKSAQHPPVRQIKQRQLHQIQYAPGDQHPSQQVPFPLAKGQKTLHPVLPFLGRRLLLLRLRLLRLEAEQIVCCHTENIRQGHHFVRLRHGLVPFPTADGLPTHLQALGQRVLAHAGSLPEGLQLLSECHRHSPFSWMPSAYQAARLHTSNQAWKFRNLRLPSSPTYHNRAPRATAPAHIARKKPRHRTSPHPSAPAYRAGSSTMGRSTISSPRRMAYSTVYRVPPGDPSKAAISSAAWSTIYRSRRCIQAGV